jgi:hypothetical protein
VNGRQWSIPLKSLAACLGFNMKRVHVLEFEEMLSGLERSDYSWGKGYGKSKRGGKVGTYLLGLPLTRN